MSWSLQELELAEVAIWPAAAKWLLLIVAALMLGLSGSYFFIAEPWRLWQQAKQQEVALVRTLIHKQQLAASLPVYQQQQAQLDQQLALVNLQLPEQRQAANLLKELSVLAQRNKLRLVSFQWQAERIFDPVIQLPLQLNVQGSYHQLGEFVAQISALSRLVVIENLEIHLPPAISSQESADAQTDMLLNVNLLAVAFVYPSVKVESMP